jgi:hypothetical protein
MYFRGIFSPSSFFWIITNDKIVIVLERDEVTLLLPPRPSRETQRKQNTHSSRGGKQQTVATHTTRSKKKHGGFTRTLILTAHNKHALSFPFLSCFITVFLSSLRNKYKNTKRSRAELCAYTFLSSLTNICFRDLVTCMIILQLSHVINVTELFFPAIYHRMIIKSFHWISAVWLITL